MIFSVCNGKMIGLYIIVNDIKYLIEHGNPYA
ncbi:hypothetical protein Sp14A_12260 [Streptococcus pluranimalium]|uniref:Uncharacterized protein n=1 Tax=Streptococcus pluranimalium TaxID=82348 RepID=A0A345VK88_9STRE|nr:hypothetical protein Sp14A_12260 [Streptococcus pluranimalium]